MVKELSLNTYSEEETQAVGQAFAARLFPGAFVALYGGLGAGKTAFARGVGMGLGIDDIKSPTFAIVSDHDGSLPLFHFDIYRLNNESELYDIGFCEYLNRGGAVIMEWPENAKSVLPLSRIDIYIECLGEFERSFSFHPRDNKHAGLIKSLEAWKGGSYADSGV